MSETLSDRRLGRQRRDGPAGDPAHGGLCTMNIQIAFRDLESGSAQTLAAEMIARAHELANRPECQCDVDVSVECTPQDAAREC